VHNKRYYCASRFARKIPYGQNIQTDTLGSLAIVVPKHSTETFSALNLSVLLPYFISWCEDPVSQTLVIPFLMIVRDELLQGSLQRSPAEEDHSIETL
jgi:hypothetical protein